MSVSQSGASLVIDQAYQIAKQRFAAVGVDADAALARLATVPISLHCWQGDDVGGFEQSGAALGGGLAVTGNYPGKARTPDELRADLRQAFSLIPGRHRLNLHAMYLDVPAARHIERDAITPEHFQSWIDWCKASKLGMDFNPTLFSHPKAAGGFTLAHPDRAIRDFWIAHCIACRRIGAHAGQQLGTACITNVWIPDGYKDTPADRLAPRQRLIESLDRVFAEKIDPRHNLDAVEGKLFGLGSESYVVGSHEFYLGYAATQQKLLCLDAGHFHPTESVADKISSVLLYVPAILLHVSRGVRWDSDHVVIGDDALRAMMREVAADNLLDRVHIGLDYFDASINRVATWIIGARATQVALLAGLLEPTAKLRAMESAGDHTGRLALFEQVKAMPLGAVWDHYCQTQNVPLDGQWLDVVRDYERRVLAKR
jgi:L-rhamnose isomerase